MASLGVANKGKLGQGSAMRDAPIDVVFTWVDDSFAGYLESLNEYATDKRDLNPNRTRDNLQLLRFAMRSVAQHLPQIRTIYLFTCRPQQPEWLDPTHPKIKLVHHDEVMAPEYLPTFSSFSIVSHLHLLPGISPKFIYIEDDMMINSNALLKFIQAPDGKPIVNLGAHHIAPIETLNPMKSSPWNLALANADQILSQRFEEGPRRQVIHGPQLFDREAMKGCLAEYPELFAETRGNRFRSGAAVPPENFVPHYLLETGQAHLAPQTQAAKVEGYVSLDNFLPSTWVQLKRVEMRKPHSIALNDNFNARPNPRVERLVRRWLATKFPSPAPWEIAGR